MANQVELDTLITSLNRELTRVEQAIQALERMARHEMGDDPLPPPLAAGENSWPGSAGKRARHRARTT